MDNENHISVLFTFPDKMFEPDFEGYNAFIDELEKLVKKYEGSFELKDE